MAGGKGAGGGSERRTREVKTCGVGRKRQRNRKEDLNSLT